MAWSDQFSNLQRTTGGFEVAAVGGFRWPTAIGRSFFSV